MKVLTKILIFSSLTLSLKSFALLSFEDAVNPELALSARALAMGNAFICKVDDSTSVLYNPAGLGTVRNSHLHLSNFYFELNKGWLTIGTSGTASDAAGNFGKAFDLDGIRELMLTNPGELSHSRFSFMPNFTTRFFSAGYLISRQTKAYIGSSSTDLFEYADRTDHGPYLAFNLSLMGGIFKIGANIIYLNRKEAIGESDRAATVDLQDADYNKGHAVYVISGAKLTLPWTMLPTFAVTIHNSNDTSWLQDSDDAPTRIERSIGVGFSLSPNLGQTTRLHFEVNYKDMANQYPGVSGQRKTTVGVEIDFFRTMFFRFGYGDGFGSAGVGIKSQKLEFDMTTYAVDRSSSGLREEQDRRFAISLSSGF